ncbi:MAG: hypothetical protein LUE86_01380 [Clostridiales bacterium]|nr:hypothetical protein [Clostridiales bacterium]
MALFQSKKTFIEEAPVKEKTKLLVFFGTERGIIPVHTAQLLKTAEKQADILLIDNSESQDLYSSVPHTDGIGSVDDMYVLSRRKYTEEAFSRFDYVIAYIGRSINFTYADHADFLFPVNDYTPDSVELLKRTAVMFPRHGQTTTMLFLNRATSKIREKNILAQIPYMGKGDLSLITEVAPEDRAGYINFLYNGKQKLSSMSGDYRNMIADICGIANEPLSSTYRKNTKQI